MNRFDALGHRYEYGEEPTLDLKLLAAAIKQANRDQKAEKEEEKARAAVASRANRRAVDAALEPQRAAMKRIDRALAANPGWTINAPPVILASMMMKGSVGAIGEPRGKTKAVLRSFEKEGWQDPMLEFLLDQQALVAVTKAKTVKQAVADWELNWPPDLGPRVKG